MIPTVGAKTLADLDTHSVTLNASYVILKVQFSSDNDDADLCNFVDINIT